METLRRYRQDQQLVTVTLDTNRGWAEVGLTQSRSLANTNENTPSNEAAKITSRGEGLNESSDDGDEAADSHSPFSAQVVGLVYDVSGLGDKKKCIRMENARGARQ